MFINENLVPIDITSLTTVSDCLFAIASLKRCTTPKALNIRYKSKSTTTKIATKLTNTIKFLKLANT